MIARREELDFTVAGFILIDVPFHEPVNSQPVAMIDNWRLPLWNGSLCIEANEKPYSLWDENCHANQGTSLPPAVLIRCTKTVPVGSGDVHFIDKYRNDPTLGWRGRYFDFIRTVYDVESNHYDMFNQDNVEQLEKVTNLIRKGIETL